MKTLLEIGTDSEGSSTQTLLLEVGKEHCCIALLDKAANRISRVQLWSFPELTLDDSVAKIIEPYRSHPFESVVVCSAFPQALLFPNKLFKKEYTALNAVYDLPAQAYFFDSIEEWQMVNAYAVPEALYDVVADRFPGARFFHCYTPAIKIYNGFIADHQLSVHFQSTSFRVLVKKDMAIHLVQTWSYQSPLDVVYYLLQLCTTFELEQQQVLLILSGLIEKDSALFAELRQYFTNVHFAQQPEIGLPQSSHPYHYFTAISNLAACVL